jgi:HEPN domain-containing protein
MTGHELKTLTQLRLKEAKVLYRNHLYDGSCYLAGYSVELALKAAICKRMGTPDFFDTIRSETARAFKIHNLDELITLAGLRPKFDAAVAANIHFRNNWSFIKTTINWSEQLRYQVGKSQIEAETMLIALTDSQNGLLPWIKKYW